MRRTVAAALLLALTACGGGDASTAPTSRPATSAPPDDAATPGPGDATPTASAVARHGSARVGYRGTRSSWVERSCETTRGPDGAVTGWMATFQDADEQASPPAPDATSSRRYVQIRVKGYTGAGRYPSERVAARFAVDAAEPEVRTEFGEPGQALTLRDGGRAGTYTGRNLRVEFDCDPADDTSTTRGEPVDRTPAAGTAYVVRPEGAVFRFEDVRCRATGGRTEVTAGTYPHFFRLRTAAKQGAPGRGDVLFTVHGVVIPFAAAATAVTVEGTPVTSGTFTHTDGAAVTRGVFACA